MAKAYKVIKQGGQLLGGHFKGDLPAYGHIRKGTPGYAQKEI